MKNKILQYWKYAIWIIILILAFLSYLTTGMHWDGGYPSGEFRLRVIDKNGNPVPIAEIEIFKKGTNKKTDGYPFDNYTKKEKIRSDQEGIIKLYKYEGGLQFGGFCWKLFWLIPMGVCEGPKFECIITAPGYKENKFSVDKIFESDYKFYEDFPKTYIFVNKNKIELKIYENKFVLEK